MRIYAAAAPLEATAALSAAPARRGDVPRSRMIARLVQCCQRAAWVAARPRAASEAEHKPLLYGRRAAPRGREGAPPGACEGRCMEPSTLPAGATGPAAAAA